MKCLFMFLISLSNLAHADKDSWFCTEESTTRQGNVWYACGTGISWTEAVSRRHAIQFAILEFQSLCAASTDCKDKKTSVVPKRSTCIKNALGAYKCYKMLEITVEDK
jgi:hypothetical protein